MAAVVCSLTCIASIYAGLV